MKTMLVYCVALGGVLALRGDVPGAVTHPAGGIPAAESRTPAEWADTMVGARVPGRGSCMPGPCVPHGSIYPSPDTLWPSPAQRHCAPSGFHNGDPVVGFSQLHAQGTGGHPSYGQFLVSPVLGSGLDDGRDPPGLDEAGLASAIELKETRPYVFRAHLGRWRTDVAVSATAHAAVYEFEYPEGNDARIVFNLARKIGSAAACSNLVCSVDAAAGEVSGGGICYGNWCPGAFPCWFCAKCDRPAQAGGRFDKGAWLSFDTRNGARTVRMKVGVSFRSIERAREYAAREIAGFDVGATAAAAKALWEEKLGAVEVEGLSAKDMRLFYSHLFHAFVQPRDRTGDMPAWPESEPVWDDHYTLWDTWKTLFPLLALLDPATVAGNVNSFAARSERNGFVGVCFCAGLEYRVGQGGDDSDNITADAFAKKIPGIDWNRAYAAMRRHAARRTPEYLKLGYVPFGVPVDYCWRMKSGSSTLGFAYNDWCCAQVARGLGFADEARALEARSRNWTNVWDAAMVDAPSGYRGFCRGRHPDGRFTGVVAREGFQNPEGRTYFGDFYEGSCWEYSYMVPGDIPGMIARMGGAKAFAARLEYAFENKLIDYGNEPSFITAWLFDFVGRGDLASRWAHAFRDAFERDEIPGDDDSGAMGSMYVFLTAGIFPIGGQDLYALHAPAAKRISFALPQSGKTFTVVSSLPADGSRFGDVYLNGVKLEKPLIRHSQILSGGILEFR